MVNIKADAHWSDVGDAIPAAHQLTVGTVGDPTGAHGGAAKPGPAPAGPGAPAAGFRPDVQGLRALAVSMVVVYHLFPRLVPGGFAGVDVFFVISGFLITGHLWREYRATGSIGLAAFWGRRAKRLLPAAAVVLAVTWVASLLVLPKSQLADAAVEVRASALYFQNWQLAHNAVDYLKSTDAASPVQHFWSLSVEEQFYLLWPLLFIAAALIARLTRLARRRRAQAAGRSGEPEGGPGRHAWVVGCLTTALVLASLAYSRYETTVNPAAAYFVTTTRIWELGAGGLLALAPARLAGPLGRQGWLSWAGLGMAVSSAFALRGTAAFPGVIALLPVTGAVLLIACGGGRGGTAPLMSARPLVFIGGISYSLYLWHWPVFALWAGWRGHAAGAVAGPLLILASVGLAGLTKSWVEDPVRQARLLAGHPWRSVSTALAAILPVMLASGYLLTLRVWNGQLGPGYPGAAVLAGTAGTVQPMPVLPPPDSVAAMRPLYWQQGCLVSTLQPLPTECAYGDTAHPRLTVALVGDSIAGNWFPALDQIARQEHWKLVTEMHGDCPWTSTLLMMGGPRDRAYTACRQWGATALRDLLGAIHPDVVIVSARLGKATYDHPRMNAAARADIGTGMADYWEQLERHGIPVVAIRETPELARPAPLCIESHPRGSASCARLSAMSAIRDTPISYAARDTAASGAPAVPVISMNDLICGPRTCDPVVGNVLVYFDTHHLTTSYSQTLAPFLRTRLLAASPVLRAAA
jgi:peptidoglycan/LPS O-acetylase OafA/YrhL